VEALNLIFPTLSSSEVGCCRAGLASVALVAAINTNPVSNIFKKHNHEQSEIDGEK
jgi:hypothetical protein